MVDLKKIPAIEIVVDGSTYHSVTSQVFFGDIEAIEKEPGKIAYQNGELLICGEDKEWIKVAIEEEIVKDGELVDIIKVKSSSVKINEGEEEISLDEKLRRLTSALEIAGSSLDEYKEEVKKETDPIKEGLEALSEKVKTKAEQEELNKIKEDLKELEDRHDSDIERVVGEALEQLGGEDLEDAFLTLKEITEALKGEGEDGKNVVTEILERLKKNEEESESLREEVEKIKDAQKETDAGVSERVKNIEDVVIPGIKEDIEGKASSEDVNEISESLKELERKAITNINGKTAEDGSITVGFEDIKTPVIEGEEGKTLVEVLEEKANAKDVDEKIDQIKTDVAEEIKPQIDSLEEKIGQASTDEEEATGLIKEIEDLDKKIESVDGGVSEKISESEKKIKEEISETEEFVKDEFERTDSLIRDLDEKQGIVNNKVEVELGMKVESVNGVESSEGKLFIDSSKINVDDMSEEPESIKDAITSIREIANKTSEEKDEAIAKVAKDLLELSERHDEEVTTIVGDVIAQMTDEETADAYKTLKEITADLVTNEASVRDLLAKIEDNSKKDVALTKEVEGIDERVKKAEAKLEDVATNEVVNKNKEDIIKLKSESATKEELKLYSTKEETKEGLDAKVSKELYNEKMSTIDSSIKSVEGSLEGKAEKDHVHDNYVEKKLYDEKVLELSNAISENAKLKEKVETLESKIPVLDEEKGTLTFSTK